MIKILFYSLLTFIFIGCGSTISIIEKPSSISNIQIEANENCSIERE